MCGREGLLPLSPGGMCLPSHKVLGIQNTEVRIQNKIIFILSPDSWHLNSCSSPFHLISYSSPAQTTASGQLTDLKRDRQSCPP